MYCSKLLVGINSPSIRLSNIFEIFILNFIYTVPYIPTIRSFYLQYYFPKNKWLASVIFKKAYGIVTVSKALENKVKNEFNYKNVRAILNPLDLKQIESLSDEEIAVDSHFIVAAGRMDKEEHLKQFDKLIESYANSNLPQKNIHLVILGTGEEQDKLEKVLMRLLLN